MTTAEQGNSNSPLPDKMTTRPDDSLIIRHVQRKDAGGCHKVESACFPPGEAASAERIRRRIDLFPQGFLIAEVGGKIIGHINSASTEKSDISDEAFKGMTGHDPAGRHMVIFSLAVLPLFRKQGVGEKLLQSFTKQARAMGKDAIMLLCKVDRMTFYRRRGFHFIGESASTHGGQKWHEMVYPLSPPHKGMCPVHRDPMGVTL